jgi:hypothetical protein
MQSIKNHSILAPSASARWIACPPSALLAAKAEVDTGSVYAEEGTLAHRLGELRLLNGLQIRNTGYPLATFAADYAEACKSPLFYDGMTDEVQVYTGHVMDLLKGAGKKARMYVEVKFPLFYRPEDTGTVDSAVFGGADKTLYITDLKFGRGVPVEAKNNKQLLIYAISAYDALCKDYAIEKAVMTIVQPRRNSITAWGLDISGLEMERDLIESAARKALRGEGDFKTGSHCRFCPLKPRCRALKDAAADMADKQFEDPALLTDAEIAGLLGSVDVITDWISSLKEYALKRAVEGVRFEGYKLVAGTSRNKITDEKAVLKALIAAGYEGSLFKRNTFITIGELKKIVDKTDFETCCVPYITKPDAPPVLVEATDPRTEYGIAKAVEDFAEFQNQ